MDEYLLRSPRAINIFVAFFLLCGEERKKMSKQQIHTRPRTCRYIINSSQYREKRIQVNDSSICCPRRFLLCMNKYCLTRAFIDISSSHHSQITNSPSTSMSSQCQSSESDPNSKSFCVICLSKTVHGVFKCQGCSQTFCLNHTKEHRDLLSEQLEELLLDQTDFLNQFHLNQHSSSILIDQIDQWEKNAINQIQQTAKNARTQIEHLAHAQQG